MPHASGFRDVVGDLAAEIADLKTEISELEAGIALSEAAIMDYIATIKDAQTRTIFRLRFIRGMAWPGRKSLLQSDGFLKAGSRPYTIGT